MVTLETPRLLLRPLQASDAQVLMEIHEDPEVIKCLTLGAPPGGITVAWRNVAMMIGHWHLRGYGHWGVVERATGEMIGRVGLWNPEGGTGIELGWVLRRNRWGQGFATEASRAALNWAWNATDIDHIISIIQPSNVRSIRIAEKIGERFECVHLLNGVEHHIYGVRRPSR